MLSSSPYFSIIIPTYCRPERLGLCLGAIAQLDYPRDRFEVVVVDDGSNPPMESMMTPWLEVLPLRLIRQENAGPASARNTGARQARGEFLIFTDDDCTPAVDWLSQLEHCAAQSPNHLIGGRTLNALPKNPYSTASQLLIDYLYDYYNADSGEATFFASNNFALPADQFDQLGGFDVTFPLAAGEDREFCDRWLHQGLPMTYAPEMQINHTHSLSLSKFWRQHFNYGRGAFHFHQIRSQRQSAPMQVEPLSFYWNLLIYPPTKGEGWRTPLLSGLFFLSQVANVAGFFWEKYRQNHASRANQFQKQKRKSRHAKG
ncbi:MAG: glycosyltransferase family 2 protein [Leptolyngbyaceae cyanobacterium]